MTNRTTNRMTNIVITGGAGFLGARLARELLATRPAARLTLIDQAPVPPDLAADDRVTAISGDLAELAERGAGGSQGGPFGGMGLILGEHGQRLGVPWIPLENGTEVSDRLVSLAGAQQQRREVQAQRHVVRHRVDRVAQAFEYGGVRFHASIRVVSGFRTFHSMRSRGPTDTGPADYSPLASSRRCA